MKVMKLQETGLKFLSAISLVILYFILSFLFFKIKINILFLFLIFVLGWVASVYSVKSINKKYPKNLRQKIQIKRLIIELLIFTLIYLLFYLIVRSTQLSLLFNM